MLGALVLLAVAAACASLPAPAATSGITVTTVVPTATSLDVSGCGPGETGRTSFGSSLPGTPQVTSLDCVVLFGSSNGTGALRMAQLDGAGPAMYAPTSGARDGSFAGDGTLTAPFGAGTAADNMNRSVLMSDGDIAMVGTCDMGATGLDVCVMRLDPTGTPDATFDGDGMRTLAIAPGASLDYGNLIAEVSGGKLLVANQCYSGATGLDHCLARLMPDGALDPTFGTGGIVTRDFTTRHDFVRGLHVLDDGRFLVAGDCEVGSSAGRRQCVARYLANGALDTSFGSGGLTAHLPGGPGPVHDTQLLVTATGSIVLGGACYIDATTDFDFCLTRYRSDGSVDTTFGAGGSTITAMSAGYDKVGDLVELDGGSVIAGGHCVTGAATGTDTCYARFAPDGTLDTSFGTAGISTLALSPGAGAELSGSLIRESSASFLFVGTCNDPVSGDQFCVARLRADGTLDTTFGTSGVVMHSGETGAGNDVARHAIALGDGRIHVAGGCDVATTGRDACVMRLDSAGHFEQYDPGTADWSTTGTSMFATCMLSTGTSSEAWPTSASCPASDGVFWKAVPGTPDTVATAPVGITNSSAIFRFGLRAAPTQPPGAYVAPISFTVVGA